MCGITGFIQPAGFEPRQGATVARRMADRLTHRGPDDAGVWVEATTGAAAVALAHRRLSILDLSAAGHQPMLSEGGRYVIVFNGEIYNHLDLRRQLGALNWRGHSDTETLLAAIATWGVEQALRRCVGMFAFAVWDCETRILTLARDRIGEKPLYYGWQNGVFMFASELKALREHPAFAGEVDRDALFLMLRYSHVPAPYCIYRDVQKLGPGMFWQARFHNDAQPDGKAQPYWSLREVALAGQAQPFNGDLHDAATELERLLDESLSGQMMADVPLGAFLSGGIDSSTVVALMQAKSNTPIKTFSIGFHEARYNEARHAAAVAKHLGTEHTELYVTPDEARAVIPRLPQIYDEPFADSSQIPTALVSELARADVTVALTGDGGDEFFGGYPGYWETHPRVARPRNRFAQAIRDGVGLLLDAIPASYWRVLTRVAGLNRPLETLVKIPKPEDPWALYRDQISRFSVPGFIAPGAQKSRILMNSPDEWPEFSTHAHRMMFIDAAYYLPDGILTKVDRATMASCLESRAPLLDHRILEFAWRLPLEMKINHGIGKRVLRELLYRHVPRALIERPKMGFGVPIHTWLRHGRLREWAEVLLDESRLRREGFFNPILIQKRWAKCIRRGKGVSGYLWSVLMFQAWLERQTR